HVISLAGGIPSDALFDFEGLSIATRQAITEQPKSAFQYGLTEGSPLLRERICALCAERGVTARAEEVMVTAGSQQALDLVMRAIVNPMNSIVKTLEATGGGDLTRRLTLSRKDEFNAI
ncbi:HAMP domain-containing protein, partial [Escherichia coli]|uniref:HAMP domain-containing protein n=1 Tax=Escherichia coli TaxID=562 RepID=UPI00227E9ECF